MIGCPTNLMHRFNSGSSAEHADRPKSAKLPQTNVESLIGASGKSRNSSMGRVGQNAKPIVDKGDDILHQQGFKIHWGGYFTVSVNLAGVAHDDHLFRLFFGEEII